MAHHSFIGAALCGANQGEEMNESIYLSIKLTQDQLVESLSRSDMSREELLDIFTALDLMIAEVEFTEELVRRLVKSLKSDSEDVKLPFIDWSKVPSK